MMYYQSLWTLTGDVLIMIIVGQFNEERKRILLKIHVHVHSLSTPHRVASVGF